MMTSKEIRKKFLDFFESKQHAIVASAPLVIKNDPTLMFTNAGMNQFKDIFLGDKPATHKRIADTQKCLRVSGKHNDLEEVGFDTYHHTMFEMLGNWSFGDYFKEDAIAWAWELLTKELGLNKDRLYVTVFEGDSAENLEKDNDAFAFWKKWIDEDRILNGNKKDNFWEMGDTGPCGPCSEIHYDMRSDDERKKVDGKLLVNQSDPQVIEIWNLVFMQFNRLANGSLQPLPAKHVDTGMGFERLVRAMQSKTSNYDTDVFMPIINAIEKLSHKKYGEQQMTDVAMRVMADHIRAISFAIADGQLPSNTGAGYVIRRILRRAVRYAFSYLEIKTPVLFELVAVTASTFDHVFPELDQQIDFVKKVIYQEEVSFLRTLENGLKRIKEIETSLKAGDTIEGKVVFELYDTYGFPIDLTRLIAREKNLLIDETGFNVEMEKQKQRSRKDADKETGDWVEVLQDNKVEFVGYDMLECDAQIIKYRTVKLKDKLQFQVVLNTTPFYAESGGQLGDKGTLTAGAEVIQVYDTKKENELIIHFVNQLPQNTKATFHAHVNDALRADAMRNHSATHLLHAALRRVLGTHVSQKGSLVSPEHLRFDFSHFAKVTNAELSEIETLVNQKIRENILRETKLLPVAEAMQSGAMALFGEKYGDVVRVVSFDENFSKELCGGTHVNQSGSIGLFKIVSESAVAAGVRRIEAVTGATAINYMNQKETLLNEIHSLLNNPKDNLKAIINLKQENDELKKQLDVFRAAQVTQQKKLLMQKIKSTPRFNYIVGEAEVDGAEELKKLSYDLKNEMKNLIAILACKTEDKVFLAVMIDEALLPNLKMKAPDVIKQLAKHIQGGGGGQPFFATAGGSNLNGISAALNEAQQLVGQL